MNRINVVWKAMEKHTQIVRRISKSNWILEKKLRRLRWISSIIHKIVSKEYINRIIRESVK